MKKVLLYVCLAYLSAAAFAQQRVSGKVTSTDDGEGLPGVSILEKGTTNGTVTDFDGSYSLAVSEGAVLIYSFIGYQPQEVTVGSRSSIDIGMEIDITQLSEIVVIGYGEVEKEDLTGAVHAISSKDFNKGVLTSPQDLLIGRIAGVQVTTTGGAPGAGATIRIRGGSSLGGASNDPLIVVDGFPIDNDNVSGTSNPLALINPNDIETFTVLKDASATAIYGSRASNGVIIITTKQGKGGKPKLTYDGRVSVSQPIDYVDVLNGDEYRALVNDLYEQGFTGINDDAVAKLGTANTDWQKEIYQTAISHDHNITYSGIKANIPFRVSYGYTDQEGILKTTSTNRHTVALNLNPVFLDDALKVNLSVKQSFANTSFGDEGAVGAAAGYDPTQPVYSGNDEFGGYFAFTDADGLPITFTSNPVSLLMLRDNQADVNRFIGNLQVDYSLPFIPGLSAVVNLGLDKSSTAGIDDALPGSTWTYRDYTGGNGRLLDYTADNHSQLMDLYGRYKKEFGIHNVEFTAGYSWQYFYRSGSTYDTNGDRTQVRQDTEFENENYLISFFGRLNYILSNKYLLTATLRNDGSSRFEGENKWGLFPAVALGWKINEEGFMSSMSTISLLKLRGGYGVTGQQNINVGANPYYPALPIYRRSIGGASYQFGDEFVPTLRPDPYDANLKWEETSTLNVGLDFGLWNDRLTGAVEVYRRTTRDLLNRIPIAGGSNFSNFLTTNVGTLENNGYEISLNGVPVSTTNFTWNAGVNLTHNENKITRLTLVDDPTYQGVAVGAIGGGVGNNIQIHSVGFPANSFYVFQQVYGADGRPIEALYVNRSGEPGEVASNGQNKYRFKNPAPTYTVGLNSRVSYLQFDFSFSGRISLGNYVYNNRQSGATLSGLYVSTGYFSNIPTEAAERGFTNPQYWSDMFVENASFFKLDNVSLGYTIEGFLMNNLILRTSITVQNALIVTKYSGIDPEVSTGIDNNIYPRPRTYLFGLGLTY